MNTNEIDVEAKRLAVIASATEECEQSIPVMRQGPMHIGLRFGNPSTGPEWDSPPGRWVVTLDGEDVTNRCQEACPGNPGFVVMVYPKGHPSYPFQHRVNGVVTTEWVPT